jgi:hypothetical protein
MRHSLQIYMIKLKNLPSRWLKNVTNLCINISAAGLSLVAMNENGVK